jgi:hypothetical protein
MNIDVAREFFSIDYPGSQLARRWNKSIKYLVRQIVDRTKCFWFGELARQVDDVIEGFRELMAHQAAANVNVFGELIERGFPLE